MGMRPRIPFHLQPKTHTPTLTSEWIHPFLNLSNLVPNSKPPNQSPSPYVSHITNILLTTPDPNLQTRLTHFCQTHLVNLSPSFVSHVLSLPSLSSHPLTSLSFFHWAKAQPRFPAHSPHAYLALLRTLLAHARTDDATALVHALCDAKPTLTPAVSTSVLKLLGDKGMLEEVLVVWRLMKESGIEPSLVSYNCLLHGLLESGFLDSALKVFDVMRGTRNPAPDVVSYNTLVKGFCKAGRTRFAVENFLRGMLSSADVLPDKITYVTLIQGLYADGDFQECFHLYVQMKERGVEVPIHAYSLVIGGLCKDGKAMQAQGVFEEMRRSGCKGNAVIFTALMDCLAKSGNEEEAMRLFEAMEMEEGFRPDEVTYSVVINCLCKSGRLEKAMEWFELCERNNVMVNAVIYSGLIQGFGKAGDVEKAEKLFHEMKGKGCAPDSYCYNALIDGFGRAGMIEEAVSLFHKMESEGCDQTVYTYTILLDGLFRKHKNEEALKLWSRMIDKGITPTVASFRVLSTGLCLSGKVDRACRILDEMAPMGVVPETAYEEMIGVLCKAGRIQQACKLADEVIEKEREIPGRVRTIFINALRKAGNMELAIKLLHSKIGIGYDKFGGIKRRVKFQTLKSL